MLHERPQGSHRWQFVAQERNGLEHERPCFVGFALVLVSTDDLGGHVGVFEVEDGFGHVGQHVDEVGNNLRAGLDGAAAPIRVGVVEPQVGDEAESGQAQALFIGVRAEGREPLSGIRLRVVVADLDTWSYLVEEWLVGCDDGGQICLGVGLAVVLAHRENRPGVEAREAVPLLKPGGEGVPAASLPRRHERGALHVGGLGFMSGECGHGIHQKKKPARAGL